jgi:hypothetical protein
MVAAMATALAAASMMTPWVTTGATRRSAFALAGDLRHAGLLTGAPARLIAAGIAAVPFVALIALALLVASQRRGQRIGGALAALTGALTAATACTVIVVGGRRAVAGATFAFVAGLLTVAVGLSVTLRSAHHG